MQTEIPGAARKIAAPPVVEFMPDDGRDGKIKGIMDEWRTLRDLEIVRVVAQSEYGSAHQTAWRQKNAVPGRLG